MTTKAIVATVCGNSGPIPLAGVSGVGVGLEAIFSAPWRQLRGHPLVSEARRPQNSGMAAGSLTAGIAPRVSCGLLRQWTARVGLAATRVSRPARGCSFHRRRAR